MKDTTYQDLTAFRNLSIDRKEEVFCNIPDEMKARVQWCVTNLRRGPEKDRKRPINPKTGKFADVTDPTTWGTFEECRNAVIDGLYDALGYCLNDDYIFVDLDQTEASATDEFAVQRKDAHYRILRKLTENNTYLERSQSGEGYHLFFRGALPGRGRRCTTRQIETYGRARFVIMTGVVPSWSTVNQTREDQTGYLMELYGNLPSAITDKGEVPEVHDSRTVAEILDKLRKAKNYEKVSHLVDGGYYLNDRRKSEEDASLAEFILHNTDDVRLAEEVFLSCPHWTADRAVKHKEADYVPRTIRFAYLARRTRRDDLVDFFQNFAIPDPQLNVPAILSGVTREFEQTTGDVVLDDLVSTVLNTVPENSILRVYMRYCDERSIATAGRDQPVMSLMSGVAFFGMLFSRWYQYDNLIPSVGIVCVGPSSAGKEECLKVPRDILTKSKLYEWQGSGDPTSGAGLTKDLGQHPHRLYLIDEFGTWLEKVSSGGNTDVTKFIRELMGRAVWYVPAKTYVSTDLAANAKPLHYPAFGFITATTEEQVMIPLSGDKVRNGFVQRFIFVPAMSAKPDYPLIPKSVLHTVPDTLLAWVKAYDPRDDEERAGTKPYTARIGDNLHIQPMVEDPLVIERDRQIKKEKNDKSRMNTQFGGRTMTLEERLEGRHLEGAKRLAMTLALSCGRMNILLSDLEWGLTVMRMSTRTFELLTITAAEQGAGKDSDTRIRLVMRRLVERGQGYTFPDEPAQFYVKHSDVWHSLGGERDRDMLKKMAREGTLTIKLHTEPGRKPITYYRVE